MNFKNVTENLFVKNNLNINDILSILDTIHTQHIDYADFYFQSKYYETWILENGIVKKGTYNIDSGAGIRIIQGERTGFSYTNQLHIDSLMKNIKIASSIIKKNEKKSNYQKYNNEIFQKHITQNSFLYPEKNPLINLSDQHKIALLMKINKVARKKDKRVEEVIACLSGTYEEICIIATDGTLITDIRPLVHLSINVRVEHNGKRELGRSGGGGRHDYDIFFKTIKSDEDIVTYWTNKAIKTALINTSAIDAPAGSVPVVLGSGWAGILLHEAVGHGLEGDFNRYQTSSFSKQIGNQVASELCTVIDNGTVKNSRGSLKIDDEGIPGQYNTLIENGILKNYMQDKLNAKLMNMSPTGNGRRESYAHLPMPRMTNTYMLPGVSTKEEIINSIDYGIYASNFSGGQVDITSGKFVFSTSEAFLIEKGKITKPIKGVTLIGSGTEIMKEISMIGNDLKLDDGIGICIKNGQSIPVCVGQPTIKINKITVGGTK